MISGGLDPTCLYKWVRLKYMGEGLLARAPFKGLLEGCGICDNLYLVD